MNKIQEIGKWSIMFALVVGFIIGMTLKNDATADACGVAALLWVWIIL